MNILKYNLRFLLFVAVITLLYGVLFVFSDFYGTPYGNGKDLLILTSHWLIIEIAVFGLLWLLAVNKYVFAIFFPVLTVLCTVYAYFRYTANVVFTAMTIELALVNDLRTDMDVITWQLVLLMLLALVASVFIVCYRWKKIRISHSWLHMLLSVVLFYVPSHVYPLARPVVNRVPFCLYEAVKSYVDNKNEIKSERPDFKGTSVCHSDSLTVVFVLGESLRSKNLQINGYKRETTPLLCSEKNVVSYPNIYTEYAFTHNSVPHIMTRSDRKDPDKAYRERSFISLMRKTGYHTAWIANQEPANTFTYFLGECDTLIYANSGKSMYVFDEWLDGDLLPHFDSILKRQESRQFILLHTIGSHWYYNSHFTPEYTRYKPLIRSRVIGSNTEEEMRNSYDNTILYSDYFWHELIRQLKNRCAILFYLSDHGECLGEDGFFTHGSDHPELHKPACFVWYSEQFAARYPEKVSHLKDNKDKKYDSTFMFHSILDAADISSPYIDPSSDILK